MAPPSGAASYKKKDGTLTVSDDEQTLTWTPAAAGAAGLTITVASITNLQQTPATSAKVMLKIFAVASNVSPNTSPDAYVFLFTAATGARAQADAIKEVLSARVNALKNGTPVATPTPSGSGGGMSAAMAIANAVSSGASSKNPWDDDNRLKGDVELQQSLLKADSTLQRMFMDSLHTKPETLTAAQFMSQFWSTRLHLLRAHAIERAQTRGSYNVLSSLKPRVEDNVTRLNISKEQIQLIFSQHPLVKRVYDENVPKLSEQQFWSRFFQSRLFKKLRGERISEADATDAILDKYLREENTEESREANVPHFLDLAGNEGHNSQRRGNRPDLDMRPSGVDKVPIIRTLNNLSEKIMANVAPADGDVTAPIGMDEEAWQKLQLRDLRGDEEQCRIALNIRDQDRFFSQTQDDEQNRAFAQQDPSQILHALQTEITESLPLGGSVPLQKLVDPADDEDEEMEDAPASRRPVGSSAALHDAFAQILGAVREQRDQMNDGTGSETQGLSASLYDRLTLTHATSTEFLHQFWQAYLSGNPERAGEVQSLSESLQRAIDRINAVANDAEAERQVEVDRLKQQARDAYERTGRKYKLNLSTIEGGEKVVTQLLGPTLHALRLALDQYKTALEAETREAAALAV
ncbi:General transcription and DNA repair factor IIH subunit tcf-29 [Penicillium macrosclerotiorum]|uniref:General transcription and DNA repair factor IIH subunit tcf-29 n=1 Tax=Penicillium macrosclerotiorum TaxID=303699 RepID=UPI002548252D|nr:General transcription and DNA repair factor IIH subunit tcf-29 [Penicillium macrosclerotiorum]KAJ5679492.1 General transcription and DNA repair factor IIH subunit tcf-29 [Penicillium macrosclerotiorum]